MAASPDMYISQYHCTEIEDHGHLYISTESAVWLWHTEEAICIDPEYTSIFRTTRGHWVTRSFCAEHGVTKILSPFDTSRWRQWGSIPGRASTRFQNRCYDYWASWAHENFSQLYLKISYVFIYASDKALSLTKEWYVENACVGFFIYIFWLSTNGAITFYDAVYLFVFVFLFAYYETIDTLKFLNIITLELTNN